MQQTVMELGGSWCGPKPLESLRVHLWEVFGGQISEGLLCLYRSLEQHLESFFTEDVV